MPSRVVFYTKPGCHLCDDARGRYELRVPVVELDGAVIAEAPIDERALARALGVRRRNHV